MRLTGKPFIQVYKGYMDLTTQTNTPSGHFTLYKRDKVVAHVLAGSLEDAFRYFIPVYRLVGITKLVSRRNIISFRGYTAQTEYRQNSVLEIYSIRRTPWRSTYNTPLIRGYGQEYLSK